MNGKTNKISNWSTILSFLPYFLVKENHGMNFRIAASYLNENKFTYTRTRICKYSLCFLKIFLVVKCMLFLQAKD